MKKKIRIGSLTRNRGNQENVSTLIILFKLCLHVVTDSKVRLEISEGKVHAAGTMSLQFFVPRKNFYLSFVVWL